jgi:hypothetical protein
MDVSDYGFIITRHVNSEKTNKYWNNCVRCIRRFYPFRKIVIIDDNSNQGFVKADYDYKNIEIIQSEYNGRGELLPYYYFLQRAFFKNAVIIHDSVFFHKRIHFERFNKLKVLPLWHFTSDKENVQNTLRISRNLKSNYYLQKLLNQSEDPLIKMELRPQKWRGVFGVQSYINYDFLKYLDIKYGITNLINVVSCRADRCCLERIFGCLFSIEYKPLTKIKSLLGSISTYQQWGYSYETYEEDISKKRLPKYVIKVWTGR